MAIQKPVPFALVLLLLRSPFFIDYLSFEYIYQFGDSINDTGNFQWDHQITMCKNFPYGQSLPPTTPSRCSDGLLIIDFFAKFFNLSMNPYLEKVNDPNQGVNFAVAGSTALESSVLSKKHIPTLFTNNSLPDQIIWFKSHLNSMCNQPSECKQKLKKAIFFLGEIGGNDYNFALLMRKPTEELYNLVPDVIKSIKTSAKELVNAGAMTMVVAGNFPIGCLPVYLSSYETNDPDMYDDLKCLKSLNDFTKFHNKLLQEAIKELQQEYPHVTLVYADYFSALRWVLKYAPSLGFDEDGLQKACCGNGANAYNFDGSHFCGTKGASVCDDPNKSISWDGLHFTQHAYKQMAQWLLQRIVPNLLDNNSAQQVI